ncbi:MAG: thioredoxin-disulfide reductase [Anaerolineales bacterium]|nr:thioredoxin-disulfide reductase [Anaerolineales bacterium]
MLIIGSGPAGLSAALYAARANLNPIVFTGSELGGQVSLTHVVENYPGFPSGISGPELIKAFKEQAEHFGSHFVNDTVDQVDFSQQPFRINTDEDEYLAKTVIIATGATPRHLQVPGEEEFTGLGVSYCATCDGHFFQDKEITIVGGGDSAIESGLFLTRYARSVTIIHHHDNLRAGAILQQRTLSHPKIRFLWDTIITDIYGNEVVEGVHLRQLKNGQTSKHSTDGVFIFAGYIPNTVPFQGQLAMDQQCYLVVDQAMQTSVQGVFAAGEVADPHYRQVVTSAAMGAIAAMQAILYLEENINILQSLP